MTKKNIFYILGTLSLIVSFIWGVTQNQKLEPWTAFIGGLLYLLGLFISDNNAATTTDKGDIKQKNFLGLFNTSRVKRYWGKVRQTNWLSIGNKQEIDNSSGSKEK